MTEEGEPAALLRRLGLTTTVRRLLLTFLDSSLVFERREAALNDPRISSVEVNRFIESLDEDKAAIALAFATRPQVLLLWAIQGTEEQRRIVAFNPATPEYVTDLLIEDPVPGVRMQLAFRPVSCNTWARLLADEALTVREALEEAFSLHEQLGYPEENRIAAERGEHSLW